MIRTLVCGMSLALALSPAVYAKELDLVVGGFSYHSDRDADYNEVHDNIGLEYDDWTVFYYRNSNRRSSVFLGKSTEGSCYASWLCSGLSYGIISGYSDKYIPVVLPKLRVDLGPVAADIHTVPGVVTQIQFNVQLGDFEQEVIPETPSTDWAIGYSNGTLGSTGEVYYRLSDNWDVRASFGEQEVKWKDLWLDYYVDQHEELDRDSFSIVFDYYPFGWDIGLYAGVAYGDLTYTTEYMWMAWIQAKKDDEDYIPVRNSDGDIVGHIQKQDFDNIKGVAEWNKLRPKFGIRLGNPWRNDRKLSLYLDIGVEYLSSLEAKVSYDIPYVEGNEEVIAVLDEAKDEWVVEQVDKYSKYKWYPVVQAGVVFRF